MMPVPHPDADHCFRLMAAYDMLPNIRAHSLMVARVAMQLCAGLAQHGQAAAGLPDRTLVLAGALLHDIAKTPCLRSGCDHARAGAEICEELGFPEIAAIVAEHVVLRRHDIERCRQGSFTAGELIYYADKRVLHEEIVSLQQRLAYIIERYGAGDPVLGERIRDNFAICLALEQALFNFLPFAPEELVLHVQGQSEGTAPGLDSFLPAAALGDG